MEKATGNEEATMQIEPAFHIRRVTPHDAPGIYDIFQRAVQQGVCSIRDKPYTLAEVQDMIAKVASVTHPILNFFVAETDTSQTSGRFSFLKKLVGSPKNHSLIGWVLVAPYSSSFGPPLARRLARTGSISTGTLEESSLDLAFRGKVQAALVERVLTACQEADSPYKTMVAEISYRDDEPRAQQVVSRYQDLGFRLVGRLEAVLEKDGVLFDQIILQRHLYPRD